VEGRKEGRKGNGELMGGLMISKARQTAE
jgi:hypothetical protein